MYVVYDVCYIIELIGYRRNWERKKKLNSNTISTSLFILAMGHAAFLQVVYRILYPSFQHLIKRYKNRRGFIHNNICIVVSWKKKSSFSGIFINFLIDRRRAKVNNTLQFLFHKLYLFQLLQVLLYHKFYKRACTIEFPLYYLNIFYIFTVPS